MQTKDYKSLYDFLNDPDPKFPASSVIITEVENSSVVDGKVRLPALVNSHIDSPTFLYNPNGFWLPYEKLKEYGASDNEIRNIRLWFDSLNLPTNHHTSAIRMSNGNYELFELDSKGNNPVWKWIWLYLRDVYKDYLDKPTKPRRDSLKPSKYIFEMLGNPKEINNIASIMSFVIDRQISTDFFKPTENLSDSYNKILSKINDCICHLYNTDKITYKDFLSVTRRLNKEYNVSYNIMYFAPFSDQLLEYVIDYFQQNDYNFDKMKMLFSDFISNKKFSQNLKERADVFLNFLEGNKIKTLKSPLNNTINILSYNISWEAMSGADKDNVLGSRCLEKNIFAKSGRSNKCFANVRNYLETFINYDFIALQEALNFRGLYNPLKSDFEVIDHISGREEIVIFYNRKYNQPRVHKTEFRRGRPIIIAFFDDIKLMIINIHPGHLPGDNYKTVEMLYRSQWSNEYPAEFKNYNIVIVGDFNSRLSSFDGKYFGRQFYGITPTEPGGGTCCFDGFNDPVFPRAVYRNGSFDHILFTNNSGERYIDRQVEYYHSDHLPVRAENLVLD